MAARKKASRKNRGARRTTTPVIDKQKLRDRLRILDDNSVLYILDDVIDVLSPTQLAEILGQYVDLKELAPDVEQIRGKSTLAADVCAFEAKCRRGEYYQDFNVNSRNYREKSAGTKSFIADCLRLLGRAVKASPNGDPAALRESFELIFDLLRAINHGDDEIAFFADEQSAEQVGVEWDEVLPAWFACLARSAPPDEYAQLVVDVVDEFESYARGRHFAAAKELCSEDHRRALTSLIRATPTR